MPSLIVPETARASFQLCITRTRSGPLAVFVLFSLDALEQSVFVIRPALTLAQAGDTVWDSFVLKYLLLASLYSPKGGWLQRMAGTLLQGVAIGTLDAPTFSLVSGYIAFLTLSLYVAGLILLALAVNGKTGMVTHTLVDECRQLSVAERQALREAILDDPGD